MRVAHPSSILIGASLLALCTQDADSGAAATDFAQTPNLAGPWAREYLVFEQPKAGHGPIANLSRRSTGQSDGTRMVGDYTNPILRPAAADVLKQRGEISAHGEAFAEPSNQCTPQPMPYILWQWEIQLLQQRDRVMILYGQDAQARRIRLNGRHPAHVAPTWQGDSVGHYEGDTLVIDTVGVKVGPLSMADRLGTPQSQSVHIVERYRLVDYKIAIDAYKQLDKDAVRIPGYFADGVAVDPFYRGKALQLEFTVEDPNVLTAPWSAQSTFLKAAGDWPEQICAENTREYYANKDTDVPRAGTPDF